MPTWRRVVGFMFRSDISYCDYFLRILKILFLPLGYPLSVSSDYLEYQIWDTIQALASSITGAIATQALLIGMGVGNPDATVLAASLAWMMKSGSGMIGKIIFVGVIGLMADVLNDAALTLELLSPHVLGLFTPIICAAELLKIYLLVTSSYFPYLSTEINVETTSQSLVSVAGTATRAAITQHQAINNNMADVAAKDNSQETLSNLLALIINISAVHFVTGKTALQYTVFALLTVVHLYANYRAVTCLRFTTFNRTRFSIGVQTWLNSRLSVTADTNTSFPSVEWVNSREPVILSLPYSNRLTGHFCNFPADLPTSGQTDLTHLREVFDKERFLVYCPDWRFLNSLDCEKHLHVHIILRNDCQAEDQFLAMLFYELLVYLSMKRGSSHLSTEVHQLTVNTDLSAFSQAALRLVHQLAGELKQTISKSNGPQWNLQNFLFSLDTW